MNSSRFSTRSVGLIVKLVAIAIRGGLKVGSPLQTMTIFTALLVAMNTMSHSYASQAPILKELMGTPTTYVSDTAGAESVQLATTTGLIGDDVVVFMTSRNITALIKLLRIEIDGTLPALNQALIGKELASLVSGGKLYITGRALDIAGFIRSPSYLFRVVLTQPETADALELGDGSEVHLFGRVPSSIVTTAPALKGLIDGVTSEALGYLASLTFLLYMLMGIASAVQGYVVMVEARKTFRVFGVLSASVEMMSLSLAAFSVMGGSSSAVLGFALGVVASALASSTLSLWVGLPHIKPVIGVGAIPVLVTSCVVASACLATGLTIGYTRRLDTS